MGKLNKIIHIKGLTLQLTHIVHQIVASIMVIKLSLLYYQNQVNEDSSSLAT